MDNASETLIFEYLSFDDAWKGILGDWFIQCLKTPFKKLPRAVITPSDSVALLIKEYLIKNDIPILGIRFLTPGMLRHYLLNVYQYSESLELRENLHLLMKVASKSLTTNPVARAAEIEPEQFVRLADLLETTGWDTGVIDNFHASTLIEKYISEQEGCGVVTAQKITNRLYEQSNCNPRAAFSDLLVFGFRSKHWSSYKMLLTAIKSSEKSMICLFTQDGTRLIDQGWLGSWEHEFGPCERVVSSAKEKPFAYLSYYFDDISPERKSTEGDQLPEIYIAEDILREAEVIIARIAEALITDEVSRLGVVFPNQTSVLAREVARLLEKEEIAHYNHLGYVGGTDCKQRLFESWVNWQNVPRLQGFLIFLDQLVNEDLLHFPEFNLFNKQAQRALQNTLTDELSVIASYIKCTKPDVSVVGIIDQWTILPEEAIFNEYIILSEPALETIGWPKDIELVKQRAGPLLKNLKTPIKKSDFLSWLNSITKPLGRIANYFGKNQYSLIHLITEEEAILQSWSHLILSGLNKGEWPGEKPQVLFLDDKRIEELNQKSLVQGIQGEGHLTIKTGLSLFPSSSDQYAIGNYNFMTLLGAPSKKLILTAHTKDPNKSKDALISEFLEKVYWISEGTLLDAESIGLLSVNTKDWVHRYRSKDFANLSIVEEVRNAYNKRRDSDKPFDEYSFCFKEPNKEAFKLPSKVWEEILTVPERAWFGHILGVKKDEVPVGKSLYGLAKGTWVHSWLTLDTHYGGKKISTVEWSAQINDNANSVFGAIERSYGQVNRTVPDIWKANWHEARRTAMALCNSLSEISESFYLFSEYAIDLIIESEKESILKVIDIPLKGRIDLMAYPANKLDDKSQPLWIIDFKTGSSGALTANKLKKGIGLQLALYALAFKLDGFDDIDLSIVQPYSMLSKQIHVSDILECKTVLDAISLIYETGKLGIRESMDKAYGGGFNFPLSTLKIEGDIIEKKWRLTHPSLYEGALTNE